MADVPDYFEFDFNDPAVCEAATVEYLNDPSVIDDFLTNLRLRLRTGFAEPNMECLKSLQTIVDTPTTADELVRKNKQAAQVFLDNYFYSLSAKCGESKNEVHNPQLPRQLPVEE